MSDHQELPETGYSCKDWNIFEEVIARFHDDKKKYFF